MRVSKVFLKSYSSQISIQRDKVSAPKSDISFGTRKSKISFVAGSLLLFSILNVFGYKSIKQEQERQNQVQQANQEIDNRQAAKIAQAKMAEELKVKEASRLVEIEKEAKIDCNIADKVFDTAFHLELSAPNKFDYLNTSADVNLPCTELGNPAFFDDTNMLYRRIVDAYQKGDVAGAAKKLGIKLGEQVKSVKK